MRRWGGGPLVAPGRRKRSPRGKEPPWAMRAAQRAPPPPLPPPPPPRDEIAFPLSCRGPPTGPPPPPSPPSPPHPPPPPLRRRYCLPHIWRRATQGSPPRLLILPRPYNQGDLLHRKRRILGVTRQ